jgi:hypothetical protein
MSTKRPHNPLLARHFHAVDADTCKQTIAESKLDYSIDMGTFTVHHGTRDSAPIVIAEHHTQKADELSGVWFDESNGEGV